MLTANSRVRSEDQRFDSDESNVSFTNHLFIRLGAKDKTFSTVDFRYCIFEGCYLRRCSFIGCDFTGCRFVSTSLHGSRFTNCIFSYATFDKTIITDEILESQAPSFENQKVRFARALRVNYQQLGEAESVNKAIKIELEATEKHLYEAWHSKKDYYRQKYSGFKRLTAFIQWLWFRSLDLLWGNGESAVKLLRSVFFLFLFMAIYDAICLGPSGQIESYWRGLCVAPEVFLGARNFPQYGYGYSALVATVRLLTFAALTSILIKRFNRR